MKKILLSFLLFIVLFSVFAKGNTETSTDKVLVITDQIGNKVAITHTPERIVSGYYISSSACIALGLEDKIVGLEEQIEKRPIYKLAAEHLIGNVANVGSAKNFDLESCIAAEPDFVILPKKAKDYSKTLNEMGIPAIVVNPESHEQLVEMITIIGTATGTGKQAEKLIARYNKILKQVEKINSKNTEVNKPVVYICNPGSYLRTAPKNMYQASLIEKTGGINAGKNLDGDSWVDISYEQFLAMNPDIIIIPTNNMANGMASFTADQIMNDKMLSDVKAVKNKAVYNMPFGFEAWDSPVPSGVLGMLWMCTKLNPEVYSLNDFKKDAADFYNTFYGFSMETKGIN